MKMTISEKGLKRLINILREFKQITEGVKSRTLYMFAIHVEILIMPIQVFMDK